MNRVLEIERRALLGLYKQPILTMERKNELWFRSALLTLAEAIEKEKTQAVAEPVQNKPRPENVPVGVFEIFVSIGYIRHAFSYRDYWIASINGGTEAEKRRFGGDSTRKQERVGRSEKTAPADSHAIQRRFRTKRTVIDRSMPFST